MQPSAPLPFFHRHAAWLLACGLLAMALQLLAGTGSMRFSTVDPGSKFVAELCTSHGVVKSDPAQTAAGGSQPASDAHDCCKLCAAGGPALAAAPVTGVSPGPTFILRQAPPSSPRALPSVWTAHAPRGPPARA